MPYSANGIDAHKPHDGDHAQHHDRRDQRRHVLLGEERAAEHVGDDERDRPMITITELDVLPHDRARPTRPRSIGHQADDREDDQDRDVRPRGEHFAHPVGEGGDTRLAQYAVIWWYEYRFHSDRSPANQHECEERPRERERDAATRFQVRRSGAVYMQNANTTTASVAPDIARQREARGHRGRSGSRT